MQFTQFDREYIILFVISCFCVGRYVCYQLDKCIIAMSFLKHIGFSCSFSLVRYEKRRKSSCYLFKMKRIPCNVIRFITRKSIKVLRFFVIMIFLSYEELKKRLHCVYFHSKSIDSLTAWLGGKRKTGFSRIQASQAVSESRIFK